MVDRIEGNPYEPIQKIQKKIEAIETFRDRIQSQTQKEIQESIPDFSTIFQQKKQSGKSSINEVIEQESKKQGLDPDLIRSVIQTESEFNPNAVSDKGAIGLMQLMPDTAAELNVDPEQPRQNIEGGVKYLAQQVDEFDDLEKALAAYNAGPGTVRQYDGVPPYRETQDYVKQVVDTFRNLKRTQGSLGEQNTQSP